MSYENPNPADEVADGSVADPDESTGGETGSATGGGSPGNQDAMGADDGLTVEEGAGRPEAVEETGADPNTSDVKQRAEKDAGEPASNGVLGTDADLQVERADG